nr:MAG TPA: hypothetical protein [Bacteriophage sp.]
MERRRTLGSEVAEMGKEWKLVKEETISEEQRTISVELAEEYEELDILILSCAAKSANNNLANTNAIVRIDSTTQKNFIGVIPKIMFKSALNRIAHIQIGRKPYLEYEYKVLNVSDINTSFVEGYVTGPGMGFDRKFDGQIKSMQIYGQAQGAMFGVGTTIIIYGR